MARARHVQALEKTKAILALAWDNLTTSCQLELVAEDLRQAHEILGEITGVVRSDEILGEIFSKFCMGK